MEGLLAAVISLLAELLDELFEPPAGPAKLILAVRLLGFGTELVLLEVSDELGELCFADSLDAEPVTGLLVVPPELPAELPELELGLFAAVRELLEFELGLLGASAPPDLLLPAGFA